MDESQLKRIMEALLFVFGQPLPMKRILETLPDLNPAQAREIIATLNAEYTSSGRAFHVQEVAGGYQLLTDQSLAEWIRRALQPPKADSVSPAALETLAIIAYRQPITKAEIEMIRGVDISGALETLTERHFVKTAGRKESPGRPFLYGTTTEFLRHFKLDSLAALPKLEDTRIAEVTNAPESEAAALRAAASSALEAVEQPSP